MTDDDALEALRDERDRLAARLRRAEDELRLIIDNVPAAIAYLDANERYGFVNRTLASWIGRSPAMLVGLHPAEVLGGEGYELLKPHLVRALGGTTVTFVVEAPYATGRRSVEMTFVPHYGAGVTPLGVVMMGIDVTERRREESERTQLLKELQDRDARLRRLRESGMLGLVNWTRDGGLVGANDTFLSIVGWSRADIDAGTVRWTDMTPPEFAHLDGRAIEEMDERGVCTPYEKEFFHKDGHRVPVYLGAAFLERSRTEGIAWILDVTARRRAEERQNVLIGVGSALARPVLDVSATAREVVGMLLDRIATVATVELFGDGDEVVEHVTKSRSGPAEHVTDAGRVIVAPLVARARTLGRLTFSSRERAYGPDDIAMAQEVGRQIGIAIDNARLFEAAQNERRHAEEASRAKDEFLAMVSHELRTPLNAMLGWATLLRGGTLAPERRDQALEVIDRNVRAQAQLVEDLLDISRVITGKLRLDVQVVELSTIVGGAVDAMRPAADGKGVTLSAVVEGDLGTVSGDPDRLRQVVYNLLSNAVRYTPRGGQVRVEVKRGDGDVEIAVTDTGEGMERDLLPHVFERFRQGEGGTTRRYGGLGLGLAIVKHIVELHGGTIEASSEGRGRGAKFTVKVPVTAPRLREVDAAPVSARRPPDSAAVERRPELAGLRALVVDDDPDARELVATILSFSDVDVVTASSAGEALQRFGERIPDVLVSDIGMPEADGYSLVEAIRKRPDSAGGRVPAIALTAFARLEDRTRALLAGYNMHVAKPIEPGELLVVVAAVSGRLNGQAARS